MNKSDFIGHLAAALAAAQGEMKPAKENAVNPFFKSRYADLASIADALREPFARNGLAYSQVVTARGGTVGVETILMHSSGEWLSDTLEVTLPEEKGLSSVQVLGKTVTYLRRYALAAIAGVYSDDDADGNPTRPTQSAAQPYKSEPPPPVPIVEVGNLGPGVTIPSKRNGNGETAHKSAVIKTPRFAELTEYLVNARHADKSSAPFKVTHIAANAGFAEITNDNLEDVLHALEAHYAEK